MDSLNLKEDISDFYSAEHKNEVLWLLVKGLSDRLNLHDFISITEMFNSELEFRKNSNRDE